MNILDLVKSMSQPTTRGGTAQNVQNVHDILGQGPYTGDLSGMAGAGPSSPNQPLVPMPGTYGTKSIQQALTTPTQPSNAHENIDAEIQQNSLMNFLIKALTQFTPLRGGLQQASELYKAMDEGFSYPDYVPDLMRKRHREGAYGIMGQDFDAFQRGIADELGYRKY
jgi:hypothetical protein